MSEPRWHSKGELGEVAFFVGDQHQFATDFRRGWWLEGLLRVSLLFTEPNATKRYDDLAERFYQETGYMAPGKSVPMEMSYHQPPDDALAAGWRDWNRKLIEKLHGDIEAALSGGGEPAPKLEFVETLDSEGEVQTSDKLTKPQEPPK